MAEENETEEEASGGGKKKIMILAIVGVLVLGGGGAAMMMGGGGAEAAAEGDPAAAEAEDKADPIYIALDPAFVVNFQDKKNRTKFLKAELNVVTFDEEIEETVNKHMPAIRNSLILLFSRQLYEDLLPHEGKETLRSEALSQVQSVLEAQTGKPGVDDLFFTSFVMQ